MRILLAEDEHALGEWLCKALEQSGCRVVWVDDGRFVEGALQNQNFDVVVLDLGLPGRSGSDVLKRLRAQDQHLPILILTARNSLADRVDSLNDGADDFLAKPFAVAELEARLMALVRRARGNSHSIFSVGELQFDATSKQFKLSGVVLSLSPREHSLLRILIQRTGEPLSRNNIMERIFGDDEDVQSSAVDVLVHRLRKRLENSGVNIVTYRGLGYVLETSASTQP